MRQIFFLLLGAAGLLLHEPALRAQDRESASALAARQANDEEIRRLRGDVQNLEAANANLQKRINQLIEDLRLVREETSHATANLASRDDLNRLAKEVRAELRELDSKRVADNKQVLDTLEKLSKVPLAAASSSAPKGDSSNSEKPKAEKGSPSEKGYWYEIKKGDTLAEIIQGCRKQGINVTSAQVKEANPDINPNKIRVGRKLWIPDPAQK